MSRLIMYKLAITLIFLCNIPFYGQTNFTISGTGSIKGTGIIGLNINLVVCGPPTYNCSTSSIATAPVQVLPLMPSINSTGYAYSSPTDFFYPSSGRGNCYTALTNSTSSSGRSFSASWSGGANNVMWDTSDSYGAITDGNNLYYIHVHYDANGCMQLDSGLTPSLSGGAGGGGFSMARDVPAQAYKLSAKTGDGTKTGLYQENLTYSGGVTGVTRTKIFDYNNCPGVDGTLTTQGGNGNVGVSDDGRYYVTSLNFPPAINGQDGAHWVLAWDRTTNSCSTWYTGIVQNAENPANGNIWSFCTGNCSQHGSNPAPLALNSVCNPTLGFGVHGNQIVHNGLYVDISGKCNNTSGSFTFWQIGTNHLETCNIALSNCGGHEANGYSTTRMIGLTYAIHQAGNLASYTTVNPHNPVGMDFHGSTNWQGTNADIYPELLESQQDVAGVSCATQPYCFELDAVRLDNVILRFGPSYHIMIPAGDLGPIAVMTQSGKCMIFESDWNNTRGLDGSGNPRKDIIAQCNLQ